MSSINYRLGALGFLHLADLFPDAEATGNLGILDMSRDCSGAETALVHSGATRTSSPSSVNRRVASP